MTSATPTKHPLDKLTTLATGEDRDEWLAARVGKMTATKVSAIAGSNPYTKLIDVWNEHTDPEYNSDHLRNIYLEERAALGSEREAEIIAWATDDDITGGPRAPFTPNVRLVGNPKLPAEFACTPDGAKIVGRKLVLIECKTTQTRWDLKGVPQHILDQMFWQMHVTGAVTVWLAAEFYEWEGRGKNKTPVLVGTMLKPYQQDAKRLAFLLEKVEQFNQWVADGIAPESDVLLTTEPAIEFGDTPEQIEEKLAQAEEAKLLDAELTELAELEERVAVDLARIEAIKKHQKQVVEQYEGRRVHLVGTRKIAKFTRFNQATKDTSLLDEKTLREITTWPERTRLVIEPNPEWVPPVEEEPEGDAPESPEVAEGVAAV